MMLPLSQFKDAISKPYKAGKRLYSDTIYTFDIEATNLFLINGKYQTFDPSIPNNSYDDALGNHVIGYDEIDKKVCPYIGMFSVNDTVYYFRDMYQLEDVLKKISNPNVTKYIYVHNLAYEMAFYRWLWIKYPITDLIALKSRKPIQFYVPYFNVIFRCSLRLTELSLEDCAKQYTSIEKKVGDLDYDKARSPLTPLTDTELGYCEYDCLVVYETIKYFRNQYGHIKCMPSTHTGKVRKAYSKKTPDKHLYMMHDLVPGVHEFKMLYMAFMGGVTHANAVNANRVLYEEIGCMDEASAYPAVLFKKYPCERFKTIDPDNIDMYNRNDYAFIYDVTLDDVTSNFYNHYIPTSKCLDGSLRGAVYDNGRIVSCDSLRIVCTCVDYELIKWGYTIGKITIHEVMAAKKDYLPSYFLNFLLDLYENKTKYKNVAGMESIYMNSKALLNSLFGCCCTNTIRATVEYDKQGIWHEGMATDEVIRKKLEDERKSKNLLFAYSTGVFCTAFNRERLMEKIYGFNNGRDLNLDIDCVYYDTDSIFMRNMEAYKDAFEDANKLVDADILACCVARGIDFNRTRPCDPDGVPHPLGHWEVDKILEEFITLGSKRYAYRKNGKVGITVSGVGKGNERDGYSADALNDDLENFNEYLVFDYDHAHKLEHSYIDNMLDIVFEDYNGIEYHSTWPDGVVLKPTTYSMSITESYRAIVNFLFSELQRDERILKEKRFTDGKEKFIR